MFYVFIPAKNGSRSKVSSLKDIRAAIIYRYIRLKSSQQAVVHSWRPWVKQGQLNSKCSV